MNVKIEETKLEIPDNFPFPFSPYPIQEDFMQNLYDTLENGKLGVFESPTGTGKSMSIICGSLKWLFDSEERKRNDIRKELICVEKEILKEENAENWFDAQFNQAKARSKKCALERMLLNMKTMEDRVQRAKDKAKPDKMDKLEKKRKNWKVNRNKAGKEASILEPEKKEKTDGDDEDVVLDDILVPEQGSDSEEESQDHEEKYFCTKIFMCSRTHSQLTQLAGEIQKSPYNELKVRVVPLASRQNLCVNDSVLGLKHLSLINEACQDLRSRKSNKATKISKSGEKLKKVKSSSCGCPYTLEENVEQLKGTCYSQVHDVEQLVSAGRALEACPYYTARSCVFDSQVVLVPYNTLLHRSTREASGIDLRGSVVIVDEAHNLLDTLNNINSACVTGLQMAHTHSLLFQYKDKFQDRFSPQNLLYLNQMIFVVQKLLQLHTKSSESTTVHRLSNFLIEAEIDHMNMITLLQFAARSRLANKLRGFIDKFQPSVNIPEKKKPEGGVSSFLKNIANKGANLDEQETAAPEPVVFGGNPVQSVLGFLETLTNHCEDGRVVVTVGKTPAESLYKFLLLNPAAHFHDVVLKARSVILAGGTMQPFSEFTDQLFLMAGASSSRIHTFSCGHVVPPSNILPISVSQGPSGRTFDFSYAHRNEPELLDELGRLLVNVCNVIPAGVVVFFTSYDYEQLVYNNFVAKGVVSRLEAKKKFSKLMGHFSESIHAVHLSSFSILRAIESPTQEQTIDVQKKVLVTRTHLIFLPQWMPAITQAKLWLLMATIVAVLREPKQSSKVEAVLSQYAKAAPTGAILFSVVGGKLSEGLNFNDDLGRCVIVVGLPYPNKNSPELKEKMDYLEANIGKGAGSVYYENLCMKAVNQSIGRSVRHLNDYAAVLLVDQRYARPNIQGALPQWIRTSLTNQASFRPVQGLLAKFFASKRAKS